MLSFKQYLREEMLDEALITFGGKAYPRFGNIVVLAGGAGSGKGWVKKKLLGIEGNTFNVDDLKEMIPKTKRIFDKAKTMGIDLDKFNIKNALRDEKNVSDLHHIVSDVLHLDKSVLSNIQKSAMLAHPDRKPNIIFDVTMKSLKSVEKYTTMMQKFGYKKENIHIVWVVNDLDIARTQNKERPRVVPDAILLDTHEGAARTVADLIKMGETLRNKMDGDFVLAFNKKDVDTEFSQSEFGGGYMSRANYVYIKRKGRPVDTKKLTKDILTKISYYTQGNFIEP